MKNFTFRTSCVESAANPINAMVDDAINITLETFRRHIKDVDEFFRGFSYAIGNERGLHIKDDWCVSFHRSKYRGVRCYYMQHSCIEYVFTEESNQ